MKSATTSVMTITPELARRTLEKSTQLNRKINKRVVYRYAEDIKRDAWRLNGETIIFDADGNLLNGHHRLTAVVLAGKPIRSFVAHDVDRTAYTTIDTGRIRSAGDVFSMADIPNANTVSAALRLVCAYDQGMLYSINNAHITNERLKACLEENPEILEWTPWHSSLAFYPGGLRAGVSYLFAREYPFKKPAVHSFWDLVGSGENLTRGTPVHTFREKMTSYRARGVRPNRSELIGLAVKALRLYLLGQSVHVLRLGKDELPDIYL